MRLERVEKIYSGGVHVVRGISLDVKDGEFLVLVGPTGCGKSTTLRMIAGVEQLSSGLIYIDNRIVNDVSPKDRDIAMVFQNLALYPQMTIYENLAFPLKMRNVSRKRINEQVLSLSAKLGLTSLLRRQPKTLSGGERQRVALV